MRPLLAALAASLLITASAQAAVPTATTGNANDITQTTVKLHGTVKPNKEATTWHFEIGPTTAYGTNTPEQGPIQAGAGGTAVSFDVGGLQPGTPYHYRLVATNGSGAKAGKDRAFTTRPAVGLDASKKLANFGEGVTLSGQVFGTNIAGITVALEENPFPFNGWNEVSTTTTDASGHYQFIRQLRSNTAWRVVAQTKPPGTSTPVFVIERDTVTLKASTSRPKRGHSVLFTGTSSPARAGNPVYIQRLGKHGWRTVLKATLSATLIPDTVSYAVRLKRVVSGVYRAFVPDGYDHLSGTSRTKRIKIRR
jgi:hypothetical protein